MAEGGPTGVPTTGRLKDRVAGATHALQVAMRKEYSQHVSAEVLCRIKDLRLALRNFNRVANDLLARYREMGERGEFLDFLSLSEVLAWDIRDELGQLAKDAEDLGIEVGSIEERHVPDCDSILNPSVNSVDLLGRSTWTTNPTSSEVAPER